MTLEKTQLTFLPVYVHTDALYSLVSLSPFTSALYLCLANAHTHLGTHTHPLKGQSTTACVCVTLIFEGPDRRCIFHAIVFMCLLSGCLYHPADDAAAPGSDVEQHISSAVWLTALRDIT
jgi:hypothetical protein